MNIIEIIVYTTNTGKKPFTEWQEKLDTKTEAIILIRLARVRNGNFGDCKQIKNGQGIYEFRINYGSGYRIYFGKDGNKIVVLLIGGDKGSQSRDITKAKRYWLDFKEQKYD
ncbi:type II toxin-antitoxin system RelE/ParE family toxin [Candidatus Babeliales bacterium]|nr:type II toxin-antitoxin system RelE/ParE family toxin [Candidatus Babeliales bacterium]MCF7899129.1 type II toxin-antitoxin system RelE/ParE family toxin [Candidatus Babeliales bacterium]